MSEPVNLDTPAGEAMIDAASGAVFDVTGQHMDDPPGGWVCLAVGRAVLAAVLSATVECAVCGGSGHMMCEAAAGEPLPPGLPCGGCCYRCGGTGRRLAIKEMLDG